VHALCDFFGFSVHARSSPGLAFFDEVCVAVFEWRSRVVERADELLFLLLTDLSLSEMVRS
jgi:hypothetical protein